MNNSLFWKIAGTFLFILILLGFVFIYITVDSAQQYSNETNQRLNANIAEFIVNEAKPNLKDGNIDTLAIQDIMHSMMVINPSVEVYLLDPAGTIITYVAPYKKVKLKEVGLGEIKTFIKAKEKPFIKGDDPRNPGGKKIFSAAPVLEEDILTGYVYVILNSQIEESVSSALFGSYILKVGLKSFLIALISALLLGLLVIWLITKNLNHIIDIFRRFKEGDLKARINSEGNNSDLHDLGNTFNEMADTIVSNIDELKKVENLRRELTANVSHDLRTPLAIMQGYMETMIMKKDQLNDTDRNKYMGIVMSSTEKMGRLIDQLFEYSKLEANQITAQKEPFFISELAQDVIQKNQIMAEKKKIDLKLEADENLPLVFADISLVERVLQNLLDNALKFTPELGTVALKLSAKANNIEIKISDSGPGIPEKDQSYIFERYHKAKEHGGSKGAGLGLAIVKKILEIHQSKIQVQSKPNEGATFFFQLQAYDKVGLTV